MKKIAIVLLAMLIAGCSSEPDYTLKIEMPELGDRYMTLNKRVSGEWETLDSVTLSAEGKGEFTGSVEVPEMMYLSVEGYQGMFPVFIDNHDYTITGTVEDLKVQADAGAQEEYNQYREQIKAYTVKQDSLRAELGNAQRAGDTVLLQSLIEEYYEVDSEKGVYDSSYIADNPSSVVSLYLLRQSYHSYSMETLRKLLDAVDETMHSSTYFTELDEHVSRMERVQVGSSYVDFALPTPEGEMLQLSELVGEGPLLIDFWAAWCNPCRRANPHVVAIYQDFSDKGFDILGVSLDNNREDWLKAIEADNLTWHHVSDLEGWQSKAAGLYAVSSIPHTVLLNKEGTIVARNLSKEELREKLSEML